MPVYGEDLTTLVGYEVPGEGFVPISDYQPSAQPSAPPVDASPLDILRAYLDAVHARDCPAALILAQAGDIIPTTNALCASSARVTAFEVTPEPLQRTDDTSVFRVMLTTTGGAFGLPDGQNGWSFTLMRQPSDPWRVSEGGPAPISPPTSTASAGGISQADAEKAAVLAAQRPTFMPIAAIAGRASEVVIEGMPVPDLPSGDTRVWFISLSDGGPPLGAQGAFVVIDYFDGTVYGVRYWIS